MVNILEFTAVFPRNTGIAGQNYSDVKFLLIKRFGESAYDIGEPPVFIKGTHSEAANKIFFIGIILLKSQ